MTTKIVDCDHRGAMAHTLTQSVSATGLSDFETATALPESHRADDLILREDTSSTQPATEPAPRSTLHLET